MALLGSEESGVGSVLTAAGETPDDDPSPDVVVADWPLTTVRTFLYDPANGNDANPGYSDVAGPYTASTQAKRTIAGLTAIFPRAFQGRTFRLLIASATIATNELDGLISGATGISNTSLIRATGTNATASATAFADDTADRIFCGATTATGAAANGYNPTAGATTTSIPCQLAGGGAAGLPAEPASPLMWRLRFDAATSTAALGNICRAVIAIAGGNTITLDAALPAVPGLTDVFYLEMAGLSFASISIGGISTAQGGTTALQVVGIRSAGIVSLGTGTWSLTFCGAGSTTTVRTPQNFQTRSTYLDPVSSITYTVGGGYRGAVVGLVVGGTLSAANIYGNSISVLCFQGVIDGVAGTAGVLMTQGTLNGLGTGISRPFRVLAPGPKTGIEVWNYFGYQDAGAMTVTVTGSGAKPAIAMRRSGGQAVLTSGVTGSTGNTDVGLDFTDARGATVFLASQPTVTGTLGDVRMADGTIISWATAFAGRKDGYGNRIFGPGAAP